MLKKIGFILIIIVALVGFPTVAYMFTQSGGFNDITDNVTSGMGATVNATSVNGTIVEVYTLGDFQEVIAKNLPIIMLTVLIVMGLIFIFMNKQNIFGGN